jgi:hypothetical protein
VEFPSKIKPWPKPVDLDRFGDQTDLGSKIFSPIRLKALSSTGFAKVDFAKLVFKDLRYQNLENKELSGAGFALGEPSLPRP